MKLGDEYIIYWVIKRLLRCKKIDQLIVATSQNIIDDDLTKAHDNDELHIHYNNWYEIRPTEDKYFHFVESCIYDEVFGDPYELNKETLDWFIEIEKEHIKDYRKSLNMLDKIKDIWYDINIRYKKEVV